MFLCTKFILYVLFLLQKAALARSQSSAARQEDVYRCPGIVTTKKIVPMVQTRNPALAVSINLTYNFHKLKEPNFRPKHQF